MVSAKSATVRYNYFAGAGPVCSVSPTACPDVASAPNGDTISLAGSGTLSIHPKSGSGGGTFIHTNAAGVVQGAGSWVVTELLSFQSYGTSPATPPTFNAGKAQFRVELRPAGTSLVLTGILDVECRLPLMKVPGGTEEGIRLVVPGVANFNKSVSGNTVFLKVS